MGVQISRLLSLLSSYSSDHHHGPSQSPYRTPLHHNAPAAPYSYGAHTPPPPLRPGLGQRYSRIPDNYQTLDQAVLLQLNRKLNCYNLTRRVFQGELSRCDNNGIIDMIITYHVFDALTHAGLESSNLIVGIDFTKSNERTGVRSFRWRSLHHLGNDSNELNPYEQAISMVGKTLSTFDEDDLIPCFGFGDATTHDQDVFSFNPDGPYCNGFDDILRRYREIVPHLRLAGPTSFAPIIEMATTIVEESGGQYHVLLIIADGQVPRSVDTWPGLSQLEQKSIDAIVKASEYPLSIILVGVGDGPWDMMRKFDDNIPARAFDNFQFVNFTEIMSKNMDPMRKEMEFALTALMEIPSQYKATIEHNILSRTTGSSPHRVPLLPPMNAATYLTNNSIPYESSSFQPSAPSYPG